MVNKIIFIMDEKNHRQKILLEGLKNFTFVHKLESIFHFKFKTYGLRLILNFFMLIPRILSMKILYDRESIFFVDFNGNPIGHISLIFFNLSTF